MRYRKYGDDIVTTLSISAPPSFVEQVSTAAKERGMSRSDLVMEAVAAHVGIALPTPNAHNTQTV